MKNTLIINNVIDVNFLCNNEVDFLIDFDIRDNAPQFLKDIFELCDNNTDYCKPFISVFVDKGTEEIGIVLEGSCLIDYVFTDSEKLEILKLVKSVK